MSTSDDATGAAAAPVASGAAQAKPPQASHPLVWVLMNFAILVLVAIPGIWDFVPGLYLRLVGHEAQATIYRIADCGTQDDNGDEEYTATLLYKDAQGQLQESTTGDSCSSGIVDGSTVSIWYLPNVPGNTVDDVLVGYLILTTLWLAGMLVALGFLLYWVWRLVRACVQAETFTRLLLAVLGCLVILAPLLLLLQYTPPPDYAGGDGPTHNFHLGQTVTAENRWAVTIQGGQVGLIHAPKAGNVCLELDITLRNLTHQTLPFHQDQFTLFDTQIKPRGVLCQADTPPLGNATLAPGAAIQATNFYEVPASMRQFYLAFRPNPQGENNVGRYIWNIQATEQGAS